MGSKPIWISRISVYSEMALPDVPARLCVGKKKHGTVDFVCERVPVTEQGLDPRHKKEQAVIRAPVAKEGTRLDATNRMDQYVCDNGD